MNFSYSATALPCACYVCGPVQWLGVYLKSNAEKVLQSSEANGPADK